MKLSPLSMRGFTLLELMVVIAIISILASLTAPTFTRQIAKANLLEAQNLATQHQSLIEEFILLNGDFPSVDDFNAVKQTLSDDSIAKTIAITESNGLKVTLNKSTGIAENAYLTYTRDTNRNWQCTSDLDANILPAKCTALAE
ncbi:pilin [Marinomonas algarum]|uniref:Pilin n=1 Tax=Marinomonas algarum TaxID=2883105 RepID=A0A9X1IRG3_9GAMM|nr:pilin [Marinomonas algarum]MCB5162773.1 pilin [Marinomonas algarum]